MLQYLSVSGFSFDAHCFPVVFMYTKFLDWMRYLSEKFLSWTLIDIFTVLNKQIAALSSDNNTKTHMDQIGNSTAHTHLINFSVFF